MRQILKKVSSICAAVFCAASLTFSGASAVWAEEQAQENDIEQIILNDIDSVTEQIVGLTEEQITALAKSEDPFTASAVDQWTSNRDELGALKDEEAQKAAGETEITHENNLYKVTDHVAFENFDADFVYLVNETTVFPESVTIDIKYPMSYTLQKAGMNTLMGIGIVFVMLVFLSFVIYLFKFIPNPELKKKEAAKAAAPAPAPVAAPVVEEVTDDTELIAVIAAAIAAAEGTTTDGFVVRSIRKVNRKRR